MSVPDRHLPGAPASAGPADALSALRDATRDIHARLDALLPLAREDAALHDYAVHLVALRGWLEGLSPVVALPQVPSAWADVHAARLQRIHADLRDCGDTPATLDDGPDRPALCGLQQAASADTAAAWGVAYVIEGSQLGGRMLHRRLQAGLSPHPLRYLAGDGDRHGWPAFTAALRNAVDTPAGTAAACAAAQAAFGVLVGRFERLGVLA